MPEFEAYVAEDVQEIGIATYVVFRTGAWAKQYTKKLRKDFERNSE